MKLLPTCLVASALVLSRESGGEGREKPYTLFYTAEGHPADVDAEISQVLAILRSENVDTVCETSKPTGYHLWADWMKTDDPHRTLLRVGLPPKDLPQLAACLSTCEENPSFFFDVPSGFLYARTSEWQALRTTAIQFGGYAIALNSTGINERQGYSPESMELMQALKNRWNPGNLLNPGAFWI